MFWRITAESREVGRPGITAYAAHNEVASDLMLNQYRPGTIKTLILAANEHSLFKFEKDTEEEKTCGPIALALRPPRCVLLLLRPPGIAKGVLTIILNALVWVLRPVMGCSDRDICSNYICGRGYLAPPTHRNNSMLKVRNKAQSTKHKAHIGS